MFIRPKKSVDYREHVIAARENFTALRYMHEMGYGPITHPISSALRMTTLMGASVVRDWLPDDRLLAYMPAALAEAMEADRALITRVISLDENASVPHIDGDVEMSSRDAARVIMRKYIPDFDEFTQVLFTSWVEETDPSKIHYYMNTKVGYRKKTLSVSKYIQMLNHKYKFRFPPTMIEQEATTFGQRYRPPSYKFVESSEVYATYAEKSFGSCMAGHRSVRFYDSQPNASVLRIEDENGILHGRAILWTGVRRYNPDTGKLMDSGVTILDRIYPSDGGSHIDAAIKHAKEMGWVYKKRQSIGDHLSEPGCYEVDIEDVEEYPYVDTLSWSVGMPHRVLMNLARAVQRRARENVYIWHSTGGYEPQTYFLSDGEDEGEDDDYDYN